jgi:hypothetical protein
MPLQATSGAASYDAFGGGVPVVPAYIEEVFSTFVFTGTGSNLTIQNEIDLSTKGGLAWMKGRVSPNAPDHHLFDTARGFTKNLTTNSTAAQNDYTTNGPTALTNGFSIPNSGGGELNRVGDTYVSWTFRKQPKFFDVITWTGNSTAGRQIPHSLGSAPGFVVVKRTSNTNNWICWHRALTSTQYIQINSTSEAFSDGGIFWNSTIPDATNLTLGNDSGVNGSGSTYVAYLFAHNAGGFGLTGTDNVISCGGTALNGSGFATVSLGYEPQFVMIKSAQYAGDWAIYDTMRGAIALKSSDLYSAFSAQKLMPNSSAAESTATDYVIAPSSTGFTLSATGYAGAAYDDFIYIAIRRGPMKVPTVGTSVFSPVARTGTGPNTTLTTSFPVDLIIGKNRAGDQGAFYDRLRGANIALRSGLTSAEVDTSPSVTGFDVSNGVKLGTDNSYQYINYTGFNYANWIMGRAPSFMDVVCYTGTGVARTVTHNLGVAPEMLIVKYRSTTGPWYVYVPSLGNTYLSLQTTNAIASAPSSLWNSTAPTSSVFSLGTLSTVNEDTGTYVAYLFGSCAGVSKVGSYTGNGTTQTIDCGLTAGARFVLIKRTDSTGDWYVYDTARGMTTLTDPYLFMNSSAAETATLGSVTTVSTGFALNSTILAAINVSGGTYIFLAIA